MQNPKIPESLDDLKLPNTITVKGEFLDFPDGLPDGLLYKFYTGLGATYCEFNAKRNSILVFPYRPLAWEKAKKYKALYVGTKPNEKSTTPEEIVEFIKQKRNNKEYIKFSVVAESFKKLLKAIESTGQNPFKEYFLVLDEVEVLQFHSSFRDQLPLCLEYLIRFDKKCMVSATMLDFSSPEIQKLERTNIEISYERKPDLKIIRTRLAPHLVFANRLIEKIKNETREESSQKYLIGINSLKAVRQIINILESSGISNISVLCSDKSKRNFDKKYTDREIEDGKLKAKINLATSAFWSGIDIEERYIPYAICLDSELHHFFSFENIIQFQGRCRKKNNYPLTVVIPQKIKSSNFQIDPIPVEQRLKELTNFLNLIEKNISSKNDMYLIKKALATGNTGIYYEGIEADIPKVNCLLSDLEKYREQLVDKLKDGASELIKELKERFNILSDQLDSNSIENLPEKDKVLLEKNYKNFLTYLTEEESDAALTRNILDNPSIQNRVAAYCYLFGKYAFKDHEKSMRLVEKISSKKNNASIYITGLMEMVRFYLDKKKLFDGFRQSLIENVPTSGKAKGNISSSELIVELEKYKNHFPSFFGKSSNDLNNSKMGRAILEAFFELEPKNPKANQIKYDISSNSELKPFRGNKEFLDFENEFSHIPVTITKLEAFDPKVSALIRHKIGKLKQ